MATLLAELEFPPIQNLVEWPNGLGVILVRLQQDRLMSVLAVVFTVILRAGPQEADGAEGRRTWPRPR
jgi:hypothetical protein